jgi:hypothetical protein
VTAAWEKRIPVSVGFFLLVVALARLNGPPMPGHEF